MLKLLSNVPFLGTAVSFVTSNVRLILEYVLIGSLLVVGGIAITLWFRTDNLEARNTQLVTEVANVASANVLQDGTIAELRQMREKDGEVVNGLVQDLKELSRWNAGARAKLAELEKQNARVRDYLDQPLPPELVCVLDGCPEAAASASQRGKGASARATTGSVRASEAASKPSK